MVFGTWNVEHNGRGRSGNEDHREEVYKMVAEHGVNVYIRQELTHAWDNGKADLYAEASAIGGLTPHMARPREGTSQNPVGVMIDTRMFDIVRVIERDLPHKTFVGFRVCLKGSPRPIDVVSAHLCHCAPDLRAVEAGWLTTRGDGGRSAIIGMDANSYPHRDPVGTTEPIDWSTVPDPAHHAHRTIWRNGRRVSDTVPSEILTGGPRPVFTDLVHHAGTRLGQQDALVPTAGLTRRTDQGPNQRIDWLLATPDLVPALLSVKTIPTRWSDHAFVIAEFSFAGLRDILSQAA